MARIQYQTTDGSRPKALTQDEADEILGGENVAGSYEIPVNVCGEDRAIMADCYEVYATDETPEDHPDGDPYADQVVILPSGYRWATDGMRAVVEEG